MFNYTNRCYQYTIGDNQLDNDWPRSNRMPVSDTFVSEPDFIAMCGRKSIHEIDEAEASAKARNRVKYAKEKAKEALFYKSEREKYDEIMADFQAEIDEAGL